MWTYNQSNGNLSRDGALVGVPAGDGPVEGAEEKQG